MIRVIVIDPKAKTVTVTALDHPELRFGRGTPSSGGKGSFLTFRGLKAQQKPR